MVFRMCGRSKTPIWEGTRHYSANNHALRFNSCDPFNGQSAERDQFGPQCDRFATKRLHSTEQTNRCNTNKNEHRFCTCLTFHTTAICRSSCRKKYFVKLEVSVCLWFPHRQLALQAIWNNNPPSYSLDPVRCKISGSTLLTYRLTINHTKIDLHVTRRGATRLMSKS